MNEQNTNERTFKITSISANPTPEQLYQAFSVTADKVDAADIKVQEILAKINELEARYSRLNIKMLIGFIIIM